MKMDIISKAVLLAFVLSEIDKGYEASTHVKVSTKSQSVCKASCLNGGERMDLPDGTYKCKCMSGFTGVICEESQSVCKASCLNGGERMDLPDGTYKCNCMSGFTGVICEVSKGCWNLTGYTGTWSWTFTNKTCQRWDSQIPHRHTHNNPHDENYCRNPAHRHGGPWCYTTDPNKRWEYCDLPFCGGCKHTKLGVEYTGTINWIYKTRCLRWDAVNHSFTPANFSGGIKNLSQAENYCRNPDHHERAPWCYMNTTKGVSPEGCYIPYCDGCMELSSYGGKKTTTESGLTCQRWDSQSPHPHNFTDATKFRSAVTSYKNLNEIENHCRYIPEDETRLRKPWCYTTDNATEWQYCGVPQC